MDWFLYDNGLRHERVKYCVSINNALIIFQGGERRNSPVKNLIFWCLHRRSTGVRQLIIHLWKVVKMVFQKSLQNSSEVVGWKSSTKK